MSERPESSGSSQQARKQYKLTAAGMKAVEAVVSQEDRGGMSNAPSSVDYPCGSFGERYPPNLSTR
jgi:hypothetical protein